jgi:hypothetical protein
MDVPPAKASLLALSVPLFIGAGIVNGTALAAARSGQDMYYLVDNALLDGPPVWVHESEVERCAVASLPGGKPPPGRAKPAS